MMRRKRTESVSYDMRTDLQRKYAAYSGVNPAQETNRVRFL